ncbi:retrovirus-related pol polyprotein from transposon TNT 1-94 [Tanacetum coccineum]
MAFLTAVASSRLPSTNNQLRTSSNLRNQATIQDDKVIVQQVQGRQGQSYASTGYKGNATSSGGNNARGQARVTVDLDSYDSDCDDVSNAKAVLMANLSNYGSDVISEVPHFEPYHTDMDNQSVHAMQSFEQTPVVDFTDIEITNSMILSVIEQILEQMINHVNNWEKANREKNNESLTAELERYIERVKTFEQHLNIDLSTREKMIDSQMDDMIKEKLALKQQIDSLEQNLSNQIKEKESLLQTFTVFKNESKEKESKYMDKEIDLEKKIKELDNIVYKVGQSAQTKAQRIKPTLYDGSVISSQHAASPVIDDEETLILEEVSRSKMLAKQNDPMSKEKKVNTTPINYVELNRLSEDFGKRFVPQQELSDEQAFWYKLHTLRLTNLFRHQSKLKLLGNFLRENTKEENVKQEMDEIGTINIKLEHIVAELFSKNECCLHKERGHLKKIYKDQFDSIKKTHALSKEHRDSLIVQLNSKSMENANLKGQIQEKVFVTTALQNELSKLKGKNVLDNAATTIAPGITQWTTYNLLVEIVEQAKAKQPLDNALDFTCKHAKRIHKLLVYVRDTCLTANKPSEKLVVVTPMNKVKKVRFSEPLTSSSNIHRQVVQIALWYLDSGCSKHMTGNRSQLMNFLAKDGLVRGIPKLKFKKDHLCSACALGKRKKSSHKPKAEDTNQEKLYLLHMDLCGPMRMERINGKRYILVIVDHYSRFTRVKFLRSKDEALEAIIKCIKNTVHNVRTNNGTEFLNQNLREFYECVGITHQTFVVRTPQQNGIVKRRSRTLLEAARTMLIFSKAPLFL